MTFSEIIATLLALLISLPLIAVGLRTLYRSYRLVKNGKLVRGKISKREGARLMIGLFIRFSPLDDREYIAETTGLTSSSFRVGDEVIVIYNPQDPFEANIHNWDFLWIWPGSLLIVGIFVLFSLLIRIISLFAQ